jgi:hypothetical protein
VADHVDDGSIKERMSAEEESGWGALVEVLDRIPPSRMHVSVVGPDDWTAKDVLFHLGVWMEEAAVHLDEIREATYRPRTFDTDARNEEYLRAGRALDVPTVRTRLERAHARLLAEWSAVEELSGPAVEWFGEDGVEHYQEHLAQLRALAEGDEATVRPGAAERRAGLLAAEAEAWHEISSLVSSMPPDLLERPGVTPEGWTVKDTMWHVAMWWQDFVDAVPRFSDPAFDPDEASDDVDSMNRAWFEESSRLDLDTVRDRWVRAREEGLAGFASMPDPPRVAERWLEECGAIHYEKHLIDLRGWHRRGSAAGAN